jgi:integrase/recombinase XerD
MKKAKRVYRIDVAAFESALQAHMKDFADLVPQQQQYIEIMINRFVNFSYDNCEFFKGHLLLTESQLMKWMKQISRKYTVEGAMRTFAIVDRFFHTLTDRGVASANPMREFVTRFGRRGWKGIAQALKSKHYYRALSSLRVSPKFTGAFGKQAKTYIHIHQAAGARYKTNEYILAEFNQFLRKHRIESIRDITPSIVLDWARSQTCRQFTCRGKLLRLAHFFRYLCSLKLVNRNPVTDAVIGSFGPPGQSFEPYIYSHQELILLLEASKQLQSDVWYKLKPETFYTLISILYAMGLRVTEALRLRVGDINIHQGTVFIRKSKFYKERVLPYGPKLSQCIQNYLDARKGIFTPVAANDPLFIGRRCEFLRATKVDKSFPRLLDASGIVVPDGERRPRLHDLRHTFAVHRLLKWYREGVDVQSKLVLLATFMGHAEIFSTQIYLTITDSLLSEANKRFYHSFGRLAKKEVKS